MNKALATFLAVILFASSANAQVSQRISGPSPVQLLSLYQESVSTVISGDCRSYPSCSEYAKQCFRENTRLRAYGLTVDRLIRCGHNHRAPQIQLAGKTFQYDPLNFHLSLVENKPKTDSSLTCLSHQEKKAMRMLKQLPRSSYDVPFLHQILTNDMSRPCRDDLNVLLSEAYREDGHSDKMLDSIKAGCARNHAPSKVELVKIYLSINSYSLAKEAIQQAPVSSESRYKCALVDADFKDCDLPRNDSFDDDVLTSYRKLLSKNPRNASLIGIIPGAGYLYAGQPGSALSSLILTSTFIALTNEAFKNEMPVLAGISGVFGLSFYVGSISGSKRALTRERDLYRQKIAKSIFN